ncbi:hypothetical protein [Achromobacter phage Motura]|uniref:Uncharacterized protein n=1 Tax=Achromobacter phage Motura TaxID=2591403 RepID=A0A514CTD5_9CAUD|nr:hypothetical protein H1O15_gp127 [Achromobacter phage Motura]QDH83726.1 hypothetical protein [Achromobacter phage Motura]
MYFGLVLLPASDFHCERLLDLTALTCADVLLRIKVITTVYIAKGFLALYFLAAVMAEARRDMTLGLVSYVVDSVFNELQTVIRSIVNCSTHLGSILFRKLATVCAIERFLYVLILRLLVAVLVLARPVSEVR